MKEHYNRSQWLLYKDDLIRGEAKLKMTGHLLSCTYCQELYLSLVTEEDVKKAERILPEGFTAKVLDAAVKEKSSFAEKRREQKPYGYHGHRLSGRFIYYVSAASITLVLMTGGLFQAIVDVVPKAGALLRDSEIILDGRFRPDWPENVVTKAALWLQEFENKGRFGHEEKE